MWPQHHLLLQNHRPSRRIFTCKVGFSCCQILIFLIMFLKMNILNNYYAQCVLAHFLIMKTNRIFCLSMIYLLWLLGSNPNNFTPWAKKSGLKLAMYSLLLSFQIICAVYSIMKNQQNIFSQRVICPFESGHNPIIAKKLSSKAISSS